MHARALPWRTPNQGLLAIALPPAVLLVLVSVWPGIAERPRPGPLGAAFRVETRLRPVDEIDEVMRRLQREHGSLVTYHRVGESAEGRPIGALEVGRRSEAVRPGVFIQAGIHGREWLTHVLSLNLVRQLLHDRPAGDSLWNDIELWVVPLVNPDGYRYSRRAPMPQGPGRERLWRKNRRATVAASAAPRGPSGSETVWYGVDLNRNFDSRWTRLGSTRPRDNTYRGPAPGSESEVDAVQRLVTSRPFVFGLDIHSGGPYQLHAPARLERRAAKPVEVLELGRRMERAFFASHPPRRWGVFRPGRFLLEASPGGQAVNFFHHRAGMAAFTVEIGRFFDGVGEDDRAALLHAWLESIRAALDAVHRGPGIMGTVRDAESGAALAARLHIRDTRVSRRSANRHATPATTRGGGRYAAYLVPGTYEIEVESEGFVPVDARVTVGEPEAGGTGWLALDYALTAAR